MAEVRKLTLFLVEKLVRAGILRTGCEDEFAQSLRGMIDVWLWTATTEGTTLNRATAERIVENLLNGFAAK